MKQSQKFSVDFHYDVHYTRSLFDRKNTLLSQIIEPKSRVAVVLDSGVAKTFPMLKDQIKSSLHSWGYIQDSDILELEGGEAIKNKLSLIEDINDLVIEASICRHSYILIIGGGAVLDAACFGASIAHRGVRHIRIPTTVLSQDDSGVGVKNGINFRGYKNFIGNFAPPYAVINDFDFLRGLERRDVLSGVAEAYKVALIKDQEFYLYLEENAEEISNCNFDIIEEIIKRCAQLHLDHIGGAGDPFEQGSSRPLDFGHWAAHKLESLSKNEVRHGEAVAIGMALDILISEQFGFISKETADRIINTFLKSGFELWHQDLEQRDDSGELQVVKGLREFQEHLGGELTLAMLTGLGSMCEVHEMPEDYVKNGLNALKELHCAV